MCCTTIFINANFNRAHNYEEQIYTLPALLIQLTCDAK